MLKDGYIYISFAQPDQKMARRLARDLASAGIQVWAKQTLQGSTRPEDAQQTKFSILEGAAAVLLIATPNVPGFDEIRDDLAIAEMMDLPIYPIWADGENWASCLPHRRIFHQYVDIRNDHYLQGLWQITHLLEGHDVELSGVVGEPEQLARSDEWSNPRNPYKGLQPFEEKDHQDFFGRNALLKTLLEMVRKQSMQVPRCLCIVGASGSGKTSIILSGLLPALRSGQLPLSKHWIYPEPIRISDHPLEAIADALEPFLPDHTRSDIIRELNDPTKRGLFMLVQQIVTGRKQRLVLIVDQFEDLFLQRINEKERQHFIEMLTYAVEAPDGQLFVITMLRAEFYDRPLQYGQLGQLLNRCGVDMLPMTIADLHEAITEPTRNPDVQISFEPILAQTLVQQVYGRPGLLSSLQLMLYLLFQKRDQQTLTLSAYHTLGSVTEIIENYAEKTYQELSSQKHQRIAHDILLSLIDVGESEQETILKSAAIESLGTSTEDQNQQISEVIIQLIDAGILTTSGDKIRISHEVLVKSWKRLANWIYEIRDDSRLNQVIHDDVTRWQQEGLPEHLLYQGGQLIEAESWAMRQSLDDTELTAFLVESRRREENQFKQVQQAEQEPGDSRALIGSVAVVVLALLLIVVYVQNQIAQRAQDRADVQSTLVAEAHSTAEAMERVQATQVVELETAQADMILLANQHGTQQAISDESIQQSETQLIIAETAQAEAENQRNIAATYQAQVSTESAVNREQIIIAENAMTAAAEQALVAETQRAVAAEAVEDRTTQVVAAVTAQAQADSQQQIVGTQIAIAETAQAESEHQRGLAATQESIALVAQEEADRQRQIASDQILTAETAQQEIQQQRESAATQVAAIETTHAQVQDNILATQAIIEQTATAGIARIGANTTQAAVIEKTAQAASNEHDVIIQTQEAVIRAGSAALETQNAIIADIESEATAQVHRLATIEMLAVQESESKATQVAIAESAQQTAQAAEQLMNTQQAQIQNLADTQSTRSAEINLIPTHEPETPEPSIEPALPSATSSPMPTEVVVDMTSLYEAVNNLLDAPDGDTQLAAILSLYALMQEDVPDQTEFLSRVLGEVTMSRPLNSDLLSMVQTGGITRMAFSHDRTFLASAGFDGIIQVWDTSSTELIYTLNGHTGEVSDIAISQDQTRLFSGGRDGTVQIWDLESGESIGLLKGHQSGVTSIAINPDASVLLSGSHDDTARLWDLTTGEEIEQFHHHMASVTDVAIHSGRGIFATASRDNTVIVQDLQSGEIVSQLIGHQGDISRIAFSPDGFYLASAGWDGTTRLWEIETGTMVNSLPHDDNVVSAVIFAEDGKTIITGSWDGRIHFWDIETSNKTSIILANTIISDLAIDSLNYRLTIAYWDGTIYEKVIGEVSTEALIEQICLNLDRNLTEEEQNLYNLDSQQVPCP